MKMYSFILKQENIQVRRVPPDSEPYVVGTIPGGYSPPLPPVATHPQPPPPHPANRMTDRRL